MLSLKHHSEIRTSVREAYQERRLERQRAILEDDVDEFGLLRLAGILAVAVLSLLTFVYF